MLSNDELIKKLPKAELHIHLEGSLEPELLFELAKRNRVPLKYESVDALRDAYVFSNLQEFLDIYYVGMQVLQTEQDYYDLATAYFRRAAADKVRHAEVFFDPQAHTDRSVALNVVVDGLCRAIDDAKPLGLSVYLIPNILRHLPADEALQTVDAMAPFANRFHGIGLDSSEVGNPPNLFVEAFDRAADLGLKRVAHAGEEGPPDYIWQALDILKVDRIDHGNRAMEDERLIERLSRQGTPLTVCPLSNLKLAVVDSLATHPLKRMLDAGIVATVNSDDPAYFGGYINDNFIQIADALNLSANDIVILAQNSFTASFLPSQDIANWHSDIQNTLTRLNADTQ